MNIGWIKLHRKFTKWGWYQKSEMVHLFLHFLLLANHDENEWQGMTIKKGQFITGLKKLKQDTGISAQTLRTCIGRLKSTSEITSKSTNRFRLITIKNWEQYQDNDNLSTSKLTSKLTNNQQTTNKQLTSNKKLKKLKNDKEEKENPLLKKEKKKPKEFFETMEYLLDIPLEDIRQFKERYYVDTRDIKQKADGLFTWCKANKKTKKNYKMFLQGTLNKDFGLK